jgi:hypothetical protein
MKSKRKLGPFTKALFCMNSIGIAFMFFLYHLATDYDGTADRNFGGPAKAALLTALYEKIEGGDPADLGLVEVYLTEPAEYGFPKTRALPQNLIPKEWDLGSATWRRRKSHCFPPGARFSPTMMTTTGSRRSSSTDLDTAALYPTIQA